METVKRMRKRAADMRTAAESFPDRAPRRKLIEAAESLKKLAERGVGLRGQARIATTMAR